MRYAVKDEAATFALGEEPGRAEFQVSHLVKGIGTESLFIILFKWPEGVSKFEFVEPEDDFIQTTGTQQGLTVELMRGGHLFAVGHLDGGDTPVQLARQDGTSIAVRQNEILTPDEAGELLVTYLKEHSSIDLSSWKLREIAVGEEASEPDNAPGPTASASRNDQHGSAAVAGVSMQRATDGGVPQGDPVNREQPPSP